MTERATQPVALRLTATNRERLLNHGGNARSAVERLLDVADEHATCEPPRKRSRPQPPQPPMRLETITTQQQGAVSTQQGKTYEVRVSGRTVFRTTSAALAETRRKAEQDRAPTRKVEVR